MKRATHILLAGVRTAIAIGLLLYFARSGAIKWAALGGLATAWPLTLAALALLLAAVTITASRLCVLLKPHGLYLSLFSSLRLTLMATFFNMCLPGAAGGDVARIYYAGIANRGRQTELAAIVLLDRTIGMFGLLLWPLVVAPFFPQSVKSLPFLNGLLWAAAALATALLAGVLVGWSRGVRSSRAVRWTLRKLPFGRHAERVWDTVQEYRRAKWTLLGAAGIALLGHTLGIGVTLLIAQAIYPAGFTWQMTVLIPLGFLANNLPVTPGGLGVGEAAFQKLFGMAGLERGAEILLGWRALMFLMALVGLVFYLQGRERYVHEAPDPARPQIGVRGEQEAAV